jgi:hypothetical protein
MTNETQGLRAWQIFFIIVGIISTVFIFFIAILIAIVLIIKPWNMDIVKTGSALINPSAESSNGYDHPLLTPSQESLLQSVGVDPADVPTELTPAQEKCAIEALGAERAQALISGATPSMTDVLKAKHCFE